VHELTVAYATVRPMLHYYNVILLLFIRVWYIKNIVIRSRIKFTKIAC